MQADQLSTVSRFLVDVLKNVIILMSIEEYMMRFKTVEDSPLSTVSYHSNNEVEQYTKPAG